MREEILEISKRFIKPLIYQLYKNLYDYFGPQNWWPAEYEFEVIVGAVLTQNTNWRNVTKAIANLKKHNLLSVEKLKNLSISELARHIKPSGFYKIKAKRLKALVEYLDKEYQGDLLKMQSKPLTQLREELLKVYGIGQETADSILLYALNKPIFVVDTYTKRVLVRHKIIEENWNYAEIQQLFRESLPRSVKIYNEYHALLVKIGKEFCRKIPKCSICPVRNILTSISS
jgi:endonuclease-3 related protein